MSDQPLLDPKNGRYQYYKGSGSGHCCFNATVVDTLRQQIMHDKLYVSDGVPQYETVCECFSEDDAKVICTGLNQRAAWNESVSYDYTTKTFSAVIDGKKQESADNGKSWTPTIDDAAVPYSTENPGEWEAVIKGVKHRSKDLHTWTRVISPFWHINFVEKDGITYAIRSREGEVWRSVDWNAANPTWVKLSLP